MERDMRRIYISHAYGGKEQNKKEVEQIIRRLIKQYPDDCFISPIHAFGWAYDIDYDTGMGWCLNLLDACHEMWIFGEHSEGVRREIAHCRANMIPHTVK